MIARDARWRAAHANTTRRRRELLTRRRNAIQEHMADLEGDGAQTIDHWVIIQEPGRVPALKRPFRGPDNLERFVREAIASYPADTSIIIVRLTWSGDLWIECGREFVTISDALDSGLPAGKRLRRRHHRAAKSAQP